VQVKSVADATVSGREHHRHAVDDHPEVAHQPCGEYLVKRAAIAAATFP